MQFLRYVLFDPLDGEVYPRLTFSDRDADELCLASFYGVMDMRHYVRLFLIIAKRWFHEYKRWKTRVVVFFIV